MDRSRYLFACVALILFTLAFGGCGGPSTANRFQQMAEARAARNRADKADEEAAARKTATEKSVAKPNSEPSVAGAVADNENDSKAESQAVKKTAVADIPGVATESSSQSSVTERIGQVPIRKEVMQIGKDAKMVAYVGESKTVGLYDIKTKSLIRKIFNPHLDPFSIAIGDLGNRMVVGGNGGSFKVFSLESVDGLDRFQQNRLRRKDALLPRKAHDSVITAVAISEPSNLVATGGADGVLKIWADHPDSQNLELKLPKGVTETVSLLSFQNDEVLFAATPSGVSFWSIAEQQVQGSDFSGGFREGDFENPPTMMVPGAGGKGLIVGDAGGKITQWIPREGKLDQSRFRAHEDAIKAVGFAEQGREMLTVSAKGEVGLWSLPIQTQQNIRLVEPPKFVTQSVTASLVGVPSRSRNFDVYSLSDGSAIRRHVLPGKSKSNESLLSGAITDDGEMVVLVSSEGRAFFQGTDRKTVASMSTGEAIQSIRNLPVVDADQQRRFVYQTRQGKIGVANYPSASPRALASRIGPVHAIDSTGTVMVNTQGADLVAVRLADGATMAETHLDEAKLGKVTSIAIADDQAILGTEDGNLLHWQISGRENKPELLVKNIHQHPIKTLGLSGFGNVMSCDTSGVMVQTSIAEVLSSLSLPESTADVAGASSANWTSQGPEIRLHGGDGKVKRSWKVTSAVVKEIAPNPINASAAAVDSQGQLAIVDSSGQVKRVSLPTRKAPPTTPDAGGNSSSDLSLAWSGDGQSIAVSTAKRIIIVDAKTAAIRSQYGLPDFGWSVIAWTNQGLMLRDPKSRLMRINAPRSIWEFESPSPITTIAIDETGDQVIAATQSGEMIRIDVTTGQKINSVAVCSSAIRSISTLQSTGSTILLDAESHIHLVDNENQKVVLPIEVPLGLRSICGGENGRKLFAGTTDGGILSWQVGDLEKPARVIPCDIEADRIVALGDQRLLVSNAKSKSIVIVSAASSMELVHPKGSTIVDASVSPDGAMVAMTDGSSTIEFVPAAASINEKSDARRDRQTNLDEFFVHQIGFNPNASSLIAIAESRGIGGKHHLFVLNPRSGEPVTNVELPGKAEAMRFSADGSLVLVQFSDHRVGVYEASSGENLEMVGAIEGLQTASFSEDATKLLLAKQVDGVANVLVQPLSALGKVKSGETAIVSLSFHKAGQYVLSSNLGGNVSFWNRASMAKPLATFQGASAPITQSSVSPDGRYVSAVYEDAENSVYIWDIEAAGAGSDQVEPSLIIRSDVQSTSAAFTSDSNFLLIGGSDGAIRARSLSEDREVAKFKGHSGPVVDIAAMDKPGQFVSAGSDKSIRSWRFPSSLPAKGAAIPQGVLADRTEVSNVPVPEPLSGLMKDDPFDAARQALISGAKTVDVLSLMNVSDDVKNKIKSTISSVMQGEKSEKISAKELSDRRRQLTRSQEKLASAVQAENLSIFADGFSNLAFVGQTNFKFGLDKQFRPVELLFSDRFLYAARPSDTRARRKIKNEDEPEVDYGDNGALLSWDYKYSRLQAHAWSIEDLKVSELVSLPDSAGVLTVPQMMLFSQDGSSRFLGNVASWSISKQPRPSDQFLAVGSAGAIREESDILTIYNINELSKNSVAPYSQYRSYEGVVTAMAFAHNSPHVAFCVRERAVHRLFIADAQTLELLKIEEINHSQPWLKGDDERGVATRNSDAAIGINALAFSPDDKMLVSHGQYAEELYKFSRWDLAWDGNELIDFRKSRKELTSDSGPFFYDSGNKPIRFISRSLREDERDPNDSNWQNKRTAGPSPRIIVQNRKGFNVVNLHTALPERVIPYLSTQHGVPEHAISDDGRWLVMGDDNGKALIYDLQDGYQYGVTINSELESIVADESHARPEIFDRPGHSGPVVGVAFSEPDPGQDYPAFVATMGEENQIKVWELYPILDPENGLRSRRWVQQVKQQSVRSVSTRRRKR